METERPQELEPEITEQFGEDVAPPWVLEMQKHFNETGTYRANDLHRLVGAPTDSVTVIAGAGDVTYQSL